METQNQEKKEIKLQDKVQRRTQLMFPVAGEEKVILLATFLDLGQAEYWDKL